MWSLDFNDQHDSLDIVKMKKKRIFEQIERKCEWICLREQSIDAGNGNAKTGNLKAKGITGMFGMHTITVTDESIMKLCVE